MSHNVYLKLLDVAPRVHPQLPLALIVAEGTGRVLQELQFLKRVTSSNSRV